MMFKKILFSGCLFLLFSGKLSAQYGSAVEYNDYLISYTDSMYRNGLKWGDVLKTAYYGKDYSKLWKARIEMNKAIERAKTQVSGLQDIMPGAYEFRMAMLDFLNFEKFTVEKAWMPFEKLTAQTSEEEFKKHMTYLQSMAKYETEYMGKLFAAQDYFAKNNGIIISRNK